MNTPRGQVYINGKFFPAEEARISVFNWGFIYGDGVFEGLPIHNGRCFRLYQHIDRLLASARYLGIESPMNRDEWVEAVRETARVNQLREGYMRPIVTRGTGPVGLRNMDRIKGPDVVIIPQWETQRTVEEAAKLQLRAKTVGVRRTPPECLDPRVKACNYQNMILAKLEQRAAGADLAIMLDIRGFVAEGTAENIFSIRRGHLLTPAAHNVLNGITRATIMEIATAQGYPVCEMNMTLYDLYNADEIFVSGSLHGITPVTEIDGRVIGQGQMGEMTQRLLKGYWEIEAKDAVPLI